MYRMKYTGWNEKGEPVCVLRTEEPLSQDALDGLLNILQGIGVEDISEEPI